MNAAILLWALLAPPRDVTRDVKQLGADSWQAREAAMDRCRGVGFLWLHRACGDPDPEIAARARQLLDEDDARFIDALPPPLPQLNCLIWVPGCYRHADLVDAWFGAGQAWAIVGAYLPAENCPVQQRQATIRLLLDLRRAGAPDCALRLFVRRMVAIEETIPVSSGGRKPPEPIPPPEEDS